MHSVTAPGSHRPCLDQPPTILSVDDLISEKSRDRAEPAKLRALATNDRTTTKTEEPQLVAQQNHGTDVAQYLFRDVCYFYIRIPA